MSVAKVIKMSLSTSSIDNAIKELKAYRDSIERKKNTLLEKLANIGLREASVRFSTAMYDGKNDSHVTLMPIANGYAIVASGTAVAFIEFGAGVYYNPGEPYPAPRPAGIVGIGQYGKGKGALRDENGAPKPWIYRGSPGSSGVLLSDGAVLTRGNPAAMPMWHASEEMQREILKVVKEVFG